MLEFELFGVPVTIHAWFVVSLAILGGLDAGLTQFVSFLIAATVAILIHEGGHALAYHRFRHRTEIELVAFGGLTRSLGGPRLRPWQSLLVSLAGPFAGFAAGAVALGGSVGLSLLPTPDFLVSTVWLFVVINVIWGLFNLVPLMPLDGGQALRAALEWTVPAKAASISQAVSIVCGLGLVAVGVMFNLTFLALMAGFLLITNLAGQAPRA